MERGGESMCGVFGVFGVNNPVGILSDMMTALQYRGEQGAGIALFRKNGEYGYMREAGSVSDLFRGIYRTGLDEDGFVAGIGSLRYGTAGNRRSLTNTQPLYSKFAWGELFLAHNGDTPNFDLMRGDLLGHGSVFTTDSDTEFLIHYIGLVQDKNPFEAVRLGINSYQGTYALVALLKDQEGIKLIAARDCFGNRPLALGTLDDGYVLASEDSAFEIVHAVPWREINPAEILVISEDGILPLNSVAPISHPLKQCVFEDIYFSYPSSKVFGLPVHRFREVLGSKLAARYGHLVLPEDVITNPPDSSNFLADGFCRNLNRPLDRVFIRRHSKVVRSFTQEDLTSRDTAVRKKMSIVGGKVLGRRVWLLDDSIVRGITSKRLIRSLKANGAKWVGVLIGSPPIKGPCQKGMDMNEDLIAAKYLRDGDPDVQSISMEIEADFLGYLTRGDLAEAIRDLGGDSRDFCFGCFENKEPIWGVW